MKKMSALFALMFLIVAAMPAAAQRRVSAEGRVSSVTHEHDGDRVYLDCGNYSFWVPSSVFGRRPLRVGDQVRLGGVYRGGVVRVDDLDWIGRYPEGNVSTLSGRVDRVNRFEQRLTLRDDRGRKIEVEGRSIADDRHRHIEFNEIRRGDYVTLRGRWDRGTFYASRIENISPR